MYKIILNTNTFERYNLSNILFQFLIKKPAFIEVIYINSVQNLLLDIKNKKFTPHTQEFLTFVIFLHINTEPKVIENSLYLLVSYLDIS